MVHKVAPVSQWGPRLPFKARSTCGSHSGSYGSLGTQNACKDIDLPVVHTAAHWGPRTHKMARSIWRWCKMAPWAHWGPIMTGIIWIYKSFMEWLQRLTGDTERLQRHRFTCGSRSGSCCSLGTENWQNVELYMTLMYSGSQGSLRTQNDRNYLDLQVVHIVALMAQWGSRRSTKAQPTCHASII